MSKKKKNKKKRANKSRSVSAASNTNRAPVQGRPAEDRPAEAATVAWMLSAIATALGVVVVGVLWLIIQSLEGEIEKELRILPNLLIFAAQVSGLVALVLTPVVHWMRKTRPPRLITCGVLLIVAIAWAVALSLPTVQV